MKKVKELSKNILMILAFILLFKLVLSYQLAKTEYKTYDYTVQTQDTLWTIAAKISDGNTIIEIKEINEMEDAQIYVGQTLKLPIYK